MTFRSGRQDMSREDCDNLPTEAFPLNAVTLQNLFAEVGMTEVDSIALLGAHTVGKVGGFDFIKPEKTKAGEWVWTLLFTDFDSSVQRAAVFLGYTWNWWYKTSIFHQFDSILISWGLRKMASSGLQNCLWDGIFLRDPRKKRWNFGPEHLEWLHFSQTIEVKNDSTFDRSSAGSYTNITFTGITGTTRSCRRRWMGTWPGTALSTSRWASLSVSRTRTATASSPSMEMNT